MSFDTLSEERNWFTVDAWIERIGITRESPLWRRVNDADLRRDIEEFLAQHPPVTFRGDRSTGNYSREAFEERLTRVVVTGITSQRGSQSAAAGTRAVAPDELDMRAVKAKARANVEGAYQEPRAHEVIPDGPWADFTRGDAFAWNWALFNYEPHGFISPGSQVRFRALQELEKGELPAVFNYPNRARELVAEGKTPISFIDDKEASNARAFRAKDVRRGVPMGWSFA